MSPCEVSGWIISTNAPFASVGVDEAVPFRERYIVYVYANEGGLVEEVFSKQ